MNPPRINRARCRKCGEEIESRHAHDFVRCKCGQLSVDGGKGYLRRGFGTEGYDELSTGFAPHEIYVPPIGER